MADNVQNTDDKVVKSAAAAQPATKEPAKSGSPGRPARKPTPTEMSGWMAAGDPG